MLLNTQGGALAADSALTAIEYHENGTASIRYQTGTEKIFILDQKLPVASMIFDVAEFYTLSVGDGVRRLRRAPSRVRHSGAQGRLGAGQFIRAGIER